MLKLMRNAKGQGFIEYALVLALIVGVVIFVGNNLMKDRTKTVYDDTTTAAVDAVGALTG